ncbi:exodeoxyribonuclease VII small subunit [Promicromonospora vindobonensis]|uniref:Exodeoxyribonuclease 7 small subunit n=1 Tax=Promicromonospora vindobonensis TaxID=195748 RepID=A0ABW5W019_9MICO
MSTDAVTDAGTDPAKDAPDVATLSYEQARDELVQVVSRLETGGEPLEASLALWERGEALATRCQEWLDGARERLAAAQSRSAESAEGAE